MLISRRLFALTLTVGLLPVAALDKGSVVKPESVGLSTTRLRRITDAMKADVAAEHVPGALALVARRGKVAYVETAGFADREKQSPVRIDTIFRIYSMSKPITSTGLMMLYEEGKFTLKDPVSKYIPEFANLQVLEEDPGGNKLVKPKRPMTVQDLLRHTAGLTYGLFSKSAVDTMYEEVKPLSATVLDDFITRLSKLPLRFHPGTQWHYSVAVDVQGKLIEALSGKRFDQYLEERIFAPLGMKDTGFHVPKDKQNRFAAMYSPDKGGAHLQLAPGAMSRNFLNDDLTFFSGGGGLVSTAADYLRFSQMMLNGGELDGVRLLSRKTVDLMASDHLGKIPGTQPTGYGFGLGFAVHTDPALSGLNGSKGEYNWSGLAGTKFWIDPVEKLIGIYMIQVLPPRSNPDPGNLFKQLAYQAIAD
ncbi:MAG: serine hydrolase domain-containing protein [Bryobacteraceae bacterium]